MRGYVYVCGKFIDTGLRLEVGRERNRIYAAAWRAFEECTGVEAPEVVYVWSAVSNDWAAFEYEARTKVGRFPVWAIFTDGDPAKALEEAQRMKAARA